MKDFISFPYYSSSGYTCLYFPWTLDNGFQMIEALVTITYFNMLQNFGTILRAALAADAYFYVQFWRC